MKCCTGQDKKGNMIHILTSTGIEGLKVILIELCGLKLFKGTHSLFDIIDDQNIQSKIAGIHLRSPRRRNISRAELTGPYTLYFGLTEG